MRGRGRDHRILIPGPRLLDQGSPDDFRHAGLLGVLKAYVVAASSSPATRRIRPPPARRIVTIKGSVTCRLRQRPQRHLSATPITLIGDVDGVADRPRILSLAEPTAPHRALS